MKRGGMRRHWWVVGAVVTAAAATAVAHAAIPGSGGMISGCYQKAQGQLRVIDAEAGDSCRASEQALSWGQQGPQGAQGVPGPAGPQGPAGPKGDPGSTPTLSLYRVSGPSVTIPAGAVRGLFAHCNGSDLATGGGFNAGGAQSVIQSGPDDQHGWFAIVANPTGIDAEANAIAQCLKVG